MLRADNNDWTTLTTAAAETARGLRIPPLKGDPHPDRVTVNVHDGTLS